MLAEFTEEMQVVHYARLAHEVHSAEEDGASFYYVTAGDLKHVWLFTATELRLMSINDLCIS